MNEFLCENNSHNLNALEAARDLCHKTFADHLCLLNLLVVLEKSTIVEKNALCRIHLNYFVIFTYLQKNSDFTCTTVALQSHSG